MTKHDKDMMINVSGWCLIIAVVIIVCSTFYYAGFQAGQIECLESLLPEHNRLNAEVDSLSKVTTRLSTTGGLLVVTGRLVQQDQELPLLGMGGRDD
jgi:hypothetical protein